MEFLSLFISLFIGGIITGNILGDMRKKVNNVVFFRWKGLQVMRKLVKPKDPRSDAQLAQRLFFGQVFRLGQDLLDSIIVPFWKLYAINKSEINAFMSWNLLNISNGTDYPNLCYARGSLFPTASTTSTYNTSDGKVSVSFSSSLSGDQASSDIAYLAIVHSDSLALYCNVEGTELRSDGKIECTIPTGLTPADVKTYLFFSNVAPGEEGFKCSDSYYMACVAP